MMHELIHAWNRYWFSPGSPRTLGYARLTICVVTAVWFGSFISSLPAWFGSDGLLNSQLSRQLMQFDQSPIWHNWSPLWISNNTTLYGAWLILGIVLSLLGATGIGGRAVLLTLLAWVIAWSHRITWLQGPVEPALVASLAYLIVEPGTRIIGNPRTKASPTANSSDTWLAGLALRLLQTHWWLLVAAGLLSQLASVIWWRGEGVWWLASAERSHLFSVELLRARPGITNAISHGVVVMQMWALWLVVIPTARPIGIGLGVVVACIYGIVADQLLYGALLCGMLISFVASRRD